MSTPTVILLHCNKQDQAFALLFHRIFTEILIIRDKSATQCNSLRYLVVTLQQYEVCLLTLISLPCYSLWSQDCDRILSIWTPIPAVSNDQLIPAFQGQKIGNTSNHLFKRPKITKTNKIKAIKCSSFT